MTLTTNSERFLRKSETNFPLSAESVKVLSRQRTDAVAFSVRFSGEWADLWRKMMKVTKAETPAELVRQALQVRALLEVMDAQGERGTLLLKSKGPEGQAIYQDVRELLELDAIEEIDTEAQPPSDHSTVN